jgi:hypothetical protein
MHVFYFIVYFKILYILMQEELPDVIFQELLYRTPHKAALRSGLCGTWMGRNERD